MRYAPIIAALASLPLTMTLPAQQPEAHMHHQVSGTVIDGAEHPELIPDLAAYRLYLVAVSEPINPTDEQRKRQDARLQKISVTDADKRILVATLANFHREYRSLVSKYNEAASAAWARQERTDIAPMLLQRDNLIQSTHDSLRAALTADGWARFDAHVQDEKKHMKMSAPEVKP